MASDIASRIKTKLLRRRQSSTTPSLISSRSATSYADTDSHNKSRWQGDHSPLSTAHNSGSDENGSMLVVERVNEAPEPTGGEKTKAVTIVNEADGEKTEEKRHSQKQNQSQSLVSGANGDPLEHPLEEERPLQVQQQEQQLEVAPADDHGQQSSSDLQSAGTTTAAAGATAGTADAPQPPTPATSSQPSASQSSQQPPHLTLRPAPSISRLHSIDEGNGNGNGDASPVTTTSIDDHPLSPHSPQSSHDNRRSLGPLELNLVVSNHNLDTPASLQASNVNTPAGHASYFSSQAPVRRQSIISHRQSGLIKSLLHGPPTAEADETLNSLDITMAPQTRKIWVKRPHASPTLVTINEDDLVDDVRDLILRKYANSLGRTFDSPDLTLRIIPRDESQQKERLLGPEEHMARTIDSHYPGGQGVGDALVIDIPRRTPRPSPRPTALYVSDDGRPPEAGDGYFPPVGGSPHHQVTVPAPTNGTGSSHPHSIAVLGTGHIPQIPSPGGTRRSHLRADRPRISRSHTSTGPNVNNSGQATAPDPNAPLGMQHFARRPSHSRAHSNSSDHKSLAQSAVPPMPTSPIAQTSQARVNTPPPRVSSPRPSTNRIKKVKKPTEFPSLQGLEGLSGGVPPISVLIVEDNPINLRLLEAFVKRLKVRWQTAMNGRDAVKKWRSGGFHLVLMDIQLPVMNGLDATREIRRLERVNSIGVFSSTPDTMPEGGESGEITEQDRLENMDLFKSPVIIVALTASSLQSDRHEALAAGCNDFLTKPVNFGWLESKVKEWGCMQALIDFNGWRKWKAFSQREEDEASKKAAAAKAKANKKSSLSSSAG